MKTRIYDHTDTRVHPHGTAQLGHDTRPVLHGSAYSEEVLTLRLPGRGDDIVSALSISRPASTM